jgi:hypothetical protein
MKRLSPFWTVIVSLLLICIALNIVFLVIPVYEIEMVEIRTSHIPTFQERYKNPYQ